MFNKEGKLEVTIYCDSTGLFSESECNADNMCDMMFDEAVVEEWFEEKISPHVDYGFEVWYLEEYTCDDTDGMYDYAVAKGDHPYFNVGNLCNVFYRDPYNYKYVVFTGDLTECREFGRENEWVWRCDDDYYDVHEEYELEVC